MSVSHEALRGIPPEAGATDQEKLYAWQMAVWAGSTILSLAEWLQEVDDLTLEVRRAPRRSWRIIEGTCSDAASAEAWASVELVPPRPVEERCPACGSPNTHRIRVHGNPSALACRDCDVRRACDV